jgi:acetyl-CoA carboxylase carboxyltransferase component
MTDHLQAALEAALGGGPGRHHEKSAQQGKLPVRERVERLLDAESKRRCWPTGSSTASGPTASSPASGRWAAARLP